MPNVSVSQVRPGSKLLKDVLTRRNNVLMNKGTVLSLRELDILQAFLVSKVTIEGEMAENEKTESQEEETPVQEQALSLYKEYDAMITLLKRTFVLARSGGTIPVLELRKQLDLLLRQVNEYDILFFKSVKYSPEDFIYHNSVKSSLTAFILGRWCGYEQKDLIPVALSGLVHDIGNIKIDETLLTKKSALTRAEFEDIQRHTTAGYQILKNVTGLNEGIKLTALQHHERVDGSGYPQRLRGDQIHPYSKLIAVVDIYHAMTSERLFKKAMSPYLVLEELSNDSFGKLDPAIVQTFIHKATQYQTGSVVKLSDGRIGEIVFSQREHPTRPWVNISGGIVNLAVERSVHVAEVIKR